jgi:hypothetical protein
MPKAMVGAKAAGPLDAMVDTGLLDNFFVRGVFGPGLFVRRIHCTHKVMQQNTP